ncbi:MAG: DCC1-like thiol-disulfide oxidoreductase family protein [Synechococcus sp.]|nr:DCC1-like thiol-disulfide oxidoreductase family protein [Synechococcus sp.]
MALTLVYDGGCPFCRHFALRSELAAGIADLEIVDGRQDHQLRHQLRQRGLNLADGAVLLDGAQAWHGSAAIAELSRRMQASDLLLSLLQQLFCSRQRAALVYPGLLIARRLALAVRGLRPDPDA